MWPYVLAAQWDENLSKGIQKWNAPIERFSPYRVSKHLYIVASGMWLNVFVCGETLYASKD